MNFNALKSMVDSLINKYQCPECKEHITDHDVDIIGAAGSTINIDIECSKCGKHSMIKSEIMAIDLSSQGNVNLDELKNQIGNIEGIALAKKNSIKDDQIVDLNKNLKEEKLNVSDLFGDK